GAQALDDQVGAHLGGHLDDQLGEAHDPDVGQVRQGLLDHLPALLEREQPVALLGVADGADHDLVEQVRGGLDELPVAVVERVEGPGVQHGGQPRASWCSGTWGPAGSGVWLVGVSLRTMVTTLAPYAFSLTTTQPAGGATGEPDSHTARPASRPPSSS